MRVGSDSFKKAKWPVNKRKGNFSLEPMIFLMYDLHQKVHKRVLQSSVEIDPVTFPKFTVDFYPDKTRCLGLQNRYFLAWDGHFVP